MLPLSVSSSTNMGSDKLGNQNDSGGRYQVGSRGIGAVTINAGAGSSSFGGTWLWIGLAAVAVVGLFIWLWRK